MIQNRRRVWVHYRQFVFCTPEGDIDDLPQADDAVNGLVAVNDLGGVVLTGLHTGPVLLEASTHDSEPPPDEGSEWDEIVEVPFHPATAVLTMSPWADTDEDNPAVEFAGPDTYRLRVHAQGRDAGWKVDNLPSDATPVERYLIQSWRAPSAPERILKQNDEAGREWREG